MPKCVKCGHDPERDGCPSCGAPNYTLGNFGGKILTVCCQTDPAKKPRGGK